MSIPSENSRADVEAGRPAEPGRLFEPPPDPRRLYRRRIDVDLPAAAAAGGWPVRENHCFARVLLDRLCGDVWTAHIASPAWRHLTDGQAVTLVAMADRLLVEGRPLLERWNRESLRRRAARP